MLTLRGLVVGCLLCVIATFGCAEGRTLTQMRDTREDAAVVGMDARGPDAAGLDARMGGADVSGCGGVDRPCCAGATPCTGVLVCRTGMCRTCGRSGESCCAGDGCNAGLTCSGGTCRGCGGRGEACCPGTMPCAAGGRCVSGMCAACECTPGDHRDTPCALCGMRTQTCLPSCTWGPIGACTGMGECAAGEVERTPCEFCGERTRTCSSACRWGLATGCMGSGECERGTTTTSVDGISCGVCQAFECDDTCHWSSTCSGCTCAPAGVACGLCGAGQHAASAACTSMCPGSCAAGTRVNSYNCAPNCGATFTSCTACPAGYRATSTQCSPVCGTCAGGAANQLTCVRI